MSIQNELMSYDPMTGSEKPYPSQSEHYRKWHGVVAWIYNPWSGKARNLGDVGTDPQGFGIVK